jgi:hypothetical protein
VSFSEWIAAELRLSSMMGFQGPNGKIAGPTVLLVSFAGPLPQNGPESIAWARSNLAWKFMIGVSQS